LCCALYLFGDGQSPGAQALRTAPKLLVLCSVPLQLAAFKLEIQRRIEGAQVVSIAGNWTEEPWAEPLWATHKFSKAEDAQQLNAELDKVVCSLGTLFLGTQFSSSGPHCPHEGGTAPGLLL